MRNFWAFIIGLTMFLSGCSFNGIDADNPFAASSSLQALAGVYQNKAQTDHPQAPALRLSTIIWREPGLAHEDVEKVEVVVVDGQTLQVSAIGPQGVVRTDRFIKGKHFNFRDGQLELKRESGLLGFTSGEVMLGIGSGKLTLGVDTKGQGKVRNEGVAAGLAFLLFPMAMQTSQDYRFLKIN